MKYLQDNGHAYEVFSAIRFLQDASEQHGKN